MLHLSESHLNGTGYGRVGTGLWIRIRVRQPFQRSVLRCGGALTVVLMMHGPVGSEPVI